MASAMNAVQILFKENSKEDFLMASELLLRLANNVLENPEEAKYRRIRVANPLLESKLLPVVGGIECLFEMGFQEDGEYLTLPVSSSLRVLRQVRDEIFSLRTTAAATHDGPTAQDSDKVAKSRQEPSAVPPATSSQATGPQQQQEGAAAAAPPQTAWSPPPPAVQTQPTQTVEDLRRKEADFLRRIQSSMSHVMQYEDPSLQQLAYSTIPVAMLKEKAETRMESPPRNMPEADSNDCLLLELLDWFKKSFFKWVDSPPCDSCGGATHHAGSANPTQEELSWGGSRVENHKCDTCGSMTHFPRYNHPAKLLETRRGRCGEWANCFTLCCRALGFEARYVLDWTDHVWTEVYSQAQKRWLHCDPCENTCDKPLLYEKGWRKKLTYVLAFSKDEIQDVTWRYSAKHNEVLARRNECREQWLVSVVHSIFRQKLRTVPETRKQEMLQRLVVELVEFVTIKTEGNQNLSGRTTGSVAWRQARRELGNTGTAVSNNRQYVFKLLQEEKHSEVVHIKYSCAQDVYIRASSHDISTGKWHSCANGLNVFRKEESDWKMAYLTREEDAETGELSWKFDLTGEDLRINKLELKASSSVFENGSVNWRICCDEKCFSVPGPQLRNFMTFELEGGRVLTVTAVLRGGQGDVAWQHAQLFRQSLDDSDFPFELILHLG